MFVCVQCARIEAYKQGALLPEEVCSQTGDHQFAAFEAAVADEWAREQDRHKTYLADQARTAAKLAVPIPPNLAGQRAFCGALWEKDEVWDSACRPTSLTMSVQPEMSLTCH